MALIEKLSAIGEAIREKTGKEELLTLDAMPAEIASIETGGSGEEITLDSIASGLFPSGDVILTVKPISGSCKSNPTITSVTMNTGGSNSLGNGQYFLGCTALKKVIIKSAKFYSSSQFFASCTALEEFVCERDAQISALDGSLLYNCTALKYVDLSASLSTLNQSCFLSCSALQTIVLRRESVVALPNVNAFNSTPFASGGTGGIAYVPSALIESYQVATNWSTLYAAGTCNFVAIEGSEYE